MRRRGFTLIELLVVIAVVSVVTGIGVRAFFSVTSSWSTQTVRLGLESKAGGALDAIGRDVAQLLATGLAGQGLRGESRLEETKRFGRVMLEDDRLVLPIGERDPGGAALRHVVHYRIDREGSLPSLVRGVGPLGGGGAVGEGLVVCAGVLSMRCEFFDGAVWQREWSRSSHPEAVRVSLVVRDEFRPEEQIARVAVFPVRVD